MSNIRPETISKYAQCLNALIDYSNLNAYHISTDFMNETVNKFGCSSDTLYLAVDRGLFEKISPGHYKPLIVSCQPIHARKVIEIKNKKMRAYYAKLKNTPKKKPEIQSLKPFTDILKQELEKSKQPTPPTTWKKKKEMSILWGLFKIKY